MAVNGSEWFDNPWTTTFSPFTDLLGSGFWLIPLTFITIVIFIKSRNPVTTSAFMLASGLLLASGNIFSEYPEMSYAYFVFAALGLIGLILGIYFDKGGN